LVTEYCKWRDYPTYDGDDTNRVGKVAGQVESPLGSSPGRRVTRERAALQKEMERQEAVSKDGNEQQQQALARHINDREFTQMAKAIRRFSAPRQSRRCGSAFEVH
jgi:hypothetical protein